MDIMAWPSCFAPTPCALQPCTHTQQNDHKMHNDLCFTAACLEWRAAWSATAAGEEEEKPPWHLLHKYGAAPVAFRRFASGSAPLRRRALPKGGQSTLSARSCLAMVCSNPVLFLFLAFLSPPPATPSLGLAPVRGLLPRLLLKHRCAFLDPSCSHL